jgi:hypothetical protein
MELDFVFFVPFVVPEQSKSKRAAPPDRPEKSQNQSTSLEHSKSLNHEGHEEHEVDECLDASRAPHGW